MHVHVAEAAYEGEQTQAAFGATPVELLERLDALTANTVAVHAIYVDEEDKRRLARSGATVIHNPTTSEYLGDGICDVAGLRELGIAVGLGTDANVRPSAIAEMRAAALLQKLARRDGAALPARDAFALATDEGARALGITAGTLRAGAPADYVVIDASQFDPWSPQCNALVYRAEDAWIQAVFIGGRRVYVGEPSEAARRARRETANIARRLM